MKKNIRFEDRPLDIRIRIETLMDILPYGAGWYERLSDKQVCAIHRKELAKLAERLLEAPAKRQNPIADDGVAGQDPIARQLSFADISAFDNPFVVSR